jgi:hypothetical protein
MKLISRSVSVLSLVALASTLVACAKTNVASPSSTPSLAFSTQSEPAVDLTGTWAFVLAASDVATSIRQECVESSGHDITKATACWDQFAHEAALEKIRFTTDDAGRTVWTSFGVEGSDEVVFLQVPVQLKSVGPGHLEGKVIGPATGKQAAQFEKASVGAMTIDVVDARTIVMNDRRKGRLVFSKE